MLWLRFTYLPPVLVKKTDAGVFSFVARVLG
jgi:hypothetical protein